MTCRWSSPTGCLSGHTSRAARQRERRGSVLLDLSWEYWSAIWPWDRQIDRLFLFSSLPSFSHISSQSRSAHYLVFPPINQCIYSLPPRQHATVPFFFKQKTNTVPRKIHTLLVLQPSLPFTLHLSLNFLQLPFFNPRKNSQVEAKKKWGNEINNLWSPVDEGWSVLGAVQWIFSLNFFVHNRTKLQSEGL